MIICIYCIFCIIMLLYYCILYYVLLITIQYIRIVALNIPWAKYSFSCLVYIPFYSVGIYSISILFTLNFNVVQTDNVEDSMISVLFTSILDLFWDLKSLPFYLNFFFFLCLNLTKPPNFYHHYTARGMRSHTSLVLFNFQFQF